MYKIVLSFLHKPVTGSLVPDMWGIVNEAFSHVRHDCSCEHHSLIERWFGALRLNPDDQRGALSTAVAQSEGATIRRSEYNIAVLSGSTFRKCAHSSSRR